MTHLDMQSVQGTVLTLLFVALGKFFEIIDLMSVLQGFAYLLSILVAFDTLSGNRLRKLISKKTGDESKSKRNKSH